MGVHVPRSPPMPCIFSKCPSLGVFTLNSGKNSSNRPFVFKFNSWRFYFVCLVTLFILEDGFIEFQVPFSLTLCSRSTDVMSFTIPGSFHFRHQACACGRVHSVQPHPREPAGAPSTHILMGSFMDSLPREACSRGHPPVAKPHVSWRRRHRIP